MRIVALGDLLLDVVVVLEQPLARDADGTAVTHLGAAGQAANVAAWAAALGASAAVVAKRADDDAGALAHAGLSRRGAEALGPVVAGRTGTVVSLVTPDGDRTMASDRGVCPDLRAEEIDPAWLDGADWLHLSGYALMRSPIGGAARRARELAPGRVSVDLSSWSVIREYGAARLRRLVEELAPDVVFANEDEERELGGPVAGPAWISKRGAEGFAVGGERFGVLPAEPVDPTGAGDALAAGFLVGGPGLAREAAARCVATLGSMP